MSKHCLVGQIGESLPSFSEPSDAHTTYVKLTGDDGELAFGLGQFVRALAARGTPVPEVGIDLLVLATLVYCADTRISRATESQDTWTREISLTVPVSETSIWEDARSIIEAMLGFLTGDLWTVRFTQGARPRMPSVQTAFTPVARVVSLFSGGLDSLIGAIDLLEAGEDGVFVSHAGEGATSDAQQRCFAALADRHPRVREARLRAWVTVPSDMIPLVPAEMTTRGRSFLFIALAVAAGSASGVPFRLVIPENGLIALNVPLDILRLGAHSTRTTHPYYLARWRELIAVIGIAAVIDNPYWSKTKGEMMAGCADPNLLHQALAASMSCASPAKGRWSGHGVQHCGHCVPCIIRRAAIAAALGRRRDPTTYTLESLTERKLDSTASEGWQIRAFQVAIDRLSRKPGIERFDIHKGGPLTDDKSQWGELALVHKRGLLEVARLLRRVSTTPNP